jgi:beta-glucosidase
MSDWGAVHATADALAGLDQQSGATLDKEIYFGAPLKSAIAEGKFPAKRLTDMVHRILRSMFAAGLFDHPPQIGEIDYAAHAKVSQQIAEEGIVLLKNANALLPLTGSAKRIAVIGRQAEVGVISGGGSAQVIPVGGPAASVPVGGDEAFWSELRTMVFDNSSPLKAIRAAAPDAAVRFDDGRYRSSAVSLAKWADVIVVFATQWMIESYDAPDLTLPDGQDDLIRAITAANPKTVVVLETGGPVEMPWLDSAGAVVEAWYPGARGGEAIANVLFGTVNPSGRLPLTFPKSIAQNPRPEIPGTGLAKRTPFDVNYTEGANVGYKWFAANNEQPLFPFGFGLSYATFAFSNLSLSDSGGLAVAFDVRNTGARTGKVTPQVYLTAAAGRKMQRLIAFKKVTLAPGQSERVTVKIDPRLLAQFDTAKPGWRRTAGITPSRSATPRRS